MKLLVKATLYYVLVALLFFGLGGLFIYNNTDKLIKEDVKNFLINREEIAITQIVNGEPLTSLNNYEQKVFIINQTEQLDELNYVDTLIYDIIDDKYQPYLQLTVNRKIGKTYYWIIASKSLIQTELLVTEIFQTMLYVFVGLLAALIGLNLLVSRNLWTPFTNTLFKLKSYQLGMSEALEFESTTTHEFLELNTILGRMTDKIRMDYSSLKEFTENASHEIQTPLAIVKSKAEMLMQSDNLDEQQFKYVKTIYNSSLRLSKLNQGLLLLAKIENQQYVSLEDIDINLLVKNNFEYFQEMVDLRKLIVITEFTGKNLVRMNSNLAQVLIGNLLKNAIRHADEGGQLRIQATDTQVIFSNSGKRIVHENFNMFEKFQKSNSDSLGLGLAIVKKICDYYQIKIQYSFHDEVHNFRLNFSTE